MAQNTGADQAKHELDPRRKAALDTALAQVEKSFGKGSAMRLGDRPEQNVEVIPTGSLALDMALGIGGLAVSLGLKDTIANVIGGFGLMLGRVIQPGDYVKVAGITGTVKDINWRQTIVRERNGNEMVIPNSILNTASLEKLDPSNECLVSVPFTAKAGVDVERMKADIVSTVEHATVGLANPQYKPVVKLNGFTPYGIDGTIYAFAKNDLLLSTMADAVAQSIAHADYLEHRAVGNGE